MIEIIQKTWISSINNSNAYTTKLTVLNAWKLSFQGKAQIAHVHIYVYAYNSRINKLMNRQSGNKTTNIGSRQTTKHLDNYVNNSP